MVTDNVSNYYVGLILALLSTLFIGISFVFKKIAFRRAFHAGKCVGDGSISYLCESAWWMGFVMMAVGETVNFVAYMFAPAVLVTPLGALSVVIGVLLSWRCLNEQLNCSASFGCLLCLFGSTLIIVYAPKEPNVVSLFELRNRCTDLSFVIYVMVILSMVITLIFILGPRYGKTNPVVFTLISGSIGSLTVIACKGIGVGLSDAINLTIWTTLNDWFFWLIVGWLTVAIIVQLHYLNRALVLFNTSVVTPLVYVFFNSFVIVTSIIFFHELSSLKKLDYLCLAVGLVIIVVGVFLMTIFKETHNFMFSELFTRFPSSHSYAAYMPVDSWSKINEEIY